MGCYLLKILIPVAILGLLFWEGVQCRTEGFNLEVSSSVTVQNGLCVTIPCTFTYDKSHFHTHTKLYGYWYMEDKQKSRHLVATSNPERIKDINARIWNRFEVSDRKLNHSDCSLTINDAEAADEGIYHFRMEKGHNAYSYSAETLSLTVTERKINVTAVGPLRAGQRESIFCKTQRCHYLKVPEITWEHNSNISVLETSQNVDHDNIEVRLDFIPTAEDHQKNVTCKVTSGERSSRRTTEKNFTLYVHYPPRRLSFNVDIEYPDGYTETLTNVSKINARVGDSLRIRCEADANPTSHPTWVSYPPNILGLTSSDNELWVPSVWSTSGGEYECQATNQEGSAWAVFYLHVKGHDSSQSNKER